MQNTVLTSIANQFGSPVYVYDAEKMESQYNRLTQAFQNVQQLRINYAVKALSNVNILSFMHSLGAGLDTVSIQEVKLGLSAGVPAQMIIFTPNGVSLEEIEEAATLGVQINIDNLSLLEQFGSKHPDIPVCIRINPHVMAGGNANISVGHIDSSLELVSINYRILFELSKTLSMRINGFICTQAVIFLISMCFCMRLKFCLPPQSILNTRILDLGVDLRCPIIPTILRPISKNWDKNWGAVSIVLQKTTAKN